MELFVPMLMLYLFAALLPDRRHNSLLLVLKFPVRLCREFVSKPLKLVYDRPPELL
jgi:hypothetical protein